MSDPPIVRRKYTRRKVSKVRKNAVAPLLHDEDLDRLWEFADALREVLGLDALYTKAARHRAKDPDHKFLEWGEGPIGGIAHRATARRGSGM